MVSSGFCFSRAIVSTQSPKQKRGLKAPLEKFTLT
jgi:hypothetical protein